MATVAARTAPHRQAEEARHSPTARTDDIIAGIEAATEDQLKALGAAAASTGAVALFHVIGVTPEAPTMKAALGGVVPEESMTIGVAELRAAWAQLSTRKSGRLWAVCVGTPHFSEAEFATLARLLAGRQVHASTPLVVSTSRHVWSRVTDAGLGVVIESSGVQVVTDTCTYNTPLLGRVEGLVLTNSAKFAWYAPANIGADVVFASLPACVESAVAGRLVADPFV